MKTSKNYRINNSNSRTANYDGNFWLAAFTVLIFGYIAFQLFYPLVSKGLLF